MKERKYTATAYIKVDETLEHVHRRQMVQFEYTSKHRNGSRANLDDCAAAAHRKYGFLAVPCDIRFTHIIPLR